MTDSQMDAPERVWLDWPQANRGEPVFDEPPENHTQAGQTKYILATPEALAASPEVQKLIAEAVAAERERCVEIAVRHWEGEPEDTIAMAAEMRAGSVPRPKPCRRVDQVQLRRRSGVGLVAGG